MPFKSKSQQRYMFAAESRGELPKGTARRWAHETDNIKKLPEKVKKVKKRNKAARLLKLASVCLAMQRKTLLAKQASAAADDVEAGGHPLSALLRAGFTLESVTKVAQLAQSARRQPSSPNSPVALTVNAVREQLS